MLKSFYATLDEIPEGDRQHYKKIGDRYVLELDGQHPVQAQVTTITEEKRTELAKVGQRAATAEAEVARLTEAAKNQPTLPSGHVPIPADEAKLLEAVKELGEGSDAKAKAESIKTKLTEHANLAKENSELKKTEQLRQVADSGINGKKLKMSMLQLIDRASALSLEEREVTETVDGKSVTKKVWQYKDNNKWLPLSEHPQIKELGPAMFEGEATANGTKVIGQVADDKTPPKQPDVGEEFFKKAQEARDKKPNPLAA